MDIDMLLVQNDKNHKSAQAALDSIVVQGDKLNKNIEKAFKSLEEKEDSKDDKLMSEVLKELKKPQKINVSLNIL